MVSNIAALKARVNLADVIGADIPLKRSGNEWKACCPFHDEDTPSFTVHTHDDGEQRYKCFGCPEQGDILDWLQKFRGLTYDKALAELRRLAGESPEPVRAPKAEKWRAIIPPEGQPAPLELFVASQNKRLRVAMSWPYQLADGTVIGYTCRVQIDADHKEYLPVQWSADGGWRQRAFDEPRPLYGLPLLGTDGDVLLVEGEKACDAARALLAPNIVLTWPGGSSAVDKVDWTPLAGRRVVLWPDCDSQRYADNHELAGEFKPFNEQPGQKAMLKIAAILLGLDCVVRLVEVPQPGGEWPNGWDLADAVADGWDANDVRTYIKEHLVIPEAVTIDLSDMQPGDSITIKSHQWETPPSFLFLGFDKGHYFYLPHFGGQIIALTAANHTPLNLGQLASLDWWGARFFVDRKQGGSIDWLAAGVWMMNQCKAVGMFDNTRVVGRGVWIDNGKTVVHQGDRLMIDGEVVDLNDHHGHNIYPARLPLRVELANPLNNKDAHQLVELCSWPKWERPISGLLLSGWLALGMVAGALEYRPSIWVMGASGSGKSEVYSHLCQPMMAGIAISCGANTSEAGIRQLLDGDALPVLFDEFEADSKAGVERAMDILRTIKLSSTDKGSMVVKGSASGLSQSFHMRTMFGLFSVMANISDAAALSRISVLELMPHDEDAAAMAAFEKFTKRAETTLTKDYVERLRARMIGLIDVIRHNVKVFKAQSVSELGMARLGDQIGTLLAGAYALHSNQRITPEAAAEWLTKQDWSQEITTREDESNEQSCLGHLLVHQIQRIEVQDGRIVTRTVDELIRKVADYTTDASLAKKDAEVALRYVGIRVEDGLVKVANKHNGLAKVMADSISPKNWRVLLARLPGAIKSTNSAYFGSSSQWIGLPIDTVLCPED